MEMSKKRLRFSDHDDLSLLREVLGQNPFEDPSVWIKIQENMVSLTKKTFSTRTLKEHLELLIKLWVKDIKVLKDRSGIEVTFTEKDSLCEEIYYMMEKNKKKKIKERNVNVSKKIGLKTRDHVSKALNKTLQEDMETRETAEAFQIPEYNVETLLGDVETMETAEDFQIPEYNVECDVDFDHTYSALTAKENLPSTNLESPINTKKERKLITSTPVPAETSTSTGTSNISKQSSKILGPVRSRKRLQNVQRQGLAYLEAFVRQQNENKRKELELEERKIVILEKQHQLSEFEIKKKMELEEARLKLEVDTRKTLAKIIEQQSAIIERHEKLINVLLTKLP